VNEGNTNG